MLGVQTLQEKSAGPKSVDVPLTESTCENYKKTVVTRTASPSCRGTVTQIKSSRTPSAEECWVGVGTLQVPSPSLESLAVESVEQQQVWWLSLADCGGWSISRFVKDVYAPGLLNGCMKVFVMVGLVLTIVTSVWGLSRLRDGLDLYDIVPSDTSESQFLAAQQKYFGFYYMFAVTQGNFEYPTKQKLLHEYHNAFNRIPWIIKNDDGGLPDSWLSLFRDWLLGKYTIDLKKYANFTFIYICTILYIDNIEAVCLKF